MSDRRLQVFHAVAKHLSFTRAAEALQLTQPAVTSQVRQLEEHFQARLLNRVRNRVTLTPAGEQVLRYAERIFALYEEMEQVVAEMTGPGRGTLVIGASTTVAEYLLPSLLGEFRARLPDVKVALHVGNTEGIVALVDANQLDLGVVEAPVADPALAVEVCCQDRLVAIVPPGHPLAASGAVTAGDLGRYPLILREPGSGTREVVVDYLRAQGLAPEQLQVGLELGNPESIKGAVEAGLGVSIISYATLSKELRLGSLVALDLSPPLRRPFSFVLRRQRHRVAALEALLEIARDFFARHGANSPTDDKT